MHVHLTSMAHASTDSEINSEDEGMELLLGGLNVFAVTPAAWENEEHHFEPPPIKALNTEQSHEKTGTHDEAPTRNIALIDITSMAEEESTHGCYDRAFHCSPDGQLVCPPVRIVDLSLINNRGNGLVATRRIRKGEVIFTEQAAEATQMPSCCTLCHDGPKAPWQSTTRSIRACQYCFRSLEPISTLGGGELPMPELWPIPEFDNGQQVQTNGQYQTDTYGRLQCASCRAIFCSKACGDAQKARLGCCCDCVAAVNAVVHALHSKEDVSGSDSDDENIDILELQPAVILAARMFLSLLQRYRSSGELDLGPFEGICGSSKDTTPLELGLEEEADDGSRYYTLNYVYEAICNSLELNNEEKKYFTLGLFHRLAGIAARNGFAVMTQSPFRTYYAGLLRAAGGRGTNRHSSTIKEVATALGSKDGTLQRDMDRKVEELCTVHVVALFSLTARINHSCDPRAEVRSEEFVDCRIDLVAKREILAGEEITISYINVGRTAGGSARDRTRRMRELRAKYLFECDCALCTESFS